jgi:hypothetical protein
MCRKPECATVRHTTWSLAAVSFVGLVGVQILSVGFGQQWTSQIAGAESFLKIERQAGGEPILRVRYPWARHERPSVEIRRLDNTAETQRARPLFFASEYMKGTNLVGMYRCEQLSAQLPASTQFTEDDVEFTILGRRNLLGKPSVLVRCRSEKPGARYGVRTVFALLDDWATDDKTLYLELPREDFAKSERIEVIFYRGGDIVWTAAIDWPGYPGGKTPAPAAATKKTTETPKAAPAAKAAAK